MHKTVDADKLNMKLCNITKNKQRYTHITNTTGSGSTAENTANQWWIQESEKARVDCQ